MGEPPDAAREIELSPAQRRVVTCPPDGGHLLVLAGPGAGKTRTIVERIGWLLAREICAPEHVLALTFSHQAADELRDRLGRSGQAGVTAATFHAFCADLLQRHGAAVGVPLPVRISDRSGQDGVISRAAEEIGWFLPERGQRPAKGTLGLKDVGDHIQRRKRAGLEPGGWRSDWPESPFARILARLDEVYCRLMRESGRLDYEDLLVEAVRLLRTDDATATLVRRGFRFVFVDELHDVSVEQFELLRLVAPPVRGNRATGPVEDGDAPGRVMAVADPNQAIYGWRGADAAAMLAAFRRVYRPRVYRLEENYRSTPTIVRAARAIVAGQLQGASGEAIAVQPDGVPVYCVGSADEAEEAARLASYVARAVADGTYAYGDIAILCRTHDRGDVAEAALLSGGVPLRRIRQGRFFDQPDVQEMLRYLDLVAALDDPAFTPALNWPRVVVDELTMIHLRRLAAARGLGLTELAARLDDLKEPVSPLSRVAIEEFLAEIAGGLDASAECDVRAVVHRLLALLARRRSALPSAERATLRGVLTFLAGPLRPLANALTRAIEAKRPVALVHGDDLDTIAAAVLLEHVLRWYLRHPAVIRSRRMEEMDGAFTVRLGEAAPVGPDGFGLAERTTRTMRYPVSIVAWRLGQLLLMGYETLDGGRFTAFDLETGSLHANTTEPLELGAVRIVDGRVLDETFATLVRPSGPRAIAFGASQVHGLVWTDVADAPDPGAALPDFFEFLGSETLVGHNVAAFDALVLRRVADAVGLPPLTNPLVDTLELAKRLLPGEPHGLANLAAALGISERQQHRAPADARLTGEVLLRLLAILRDERELDALGEGLPLVALGIIGAGGPVADELETLVVAGARAAAMGQGMALVERLRALATNDPLEAAERELGHRLRRVPEDDDRWIELEAEWRRLIEGYLSAGNDPSLGAFLRFAALATSLDEDLAARDRVTLMTIHSAKGREWPLVFVIGVEDGMVPFWRATSPEEIEEERRVLYVAMTRARRQLCLMWANETGGRERPLSSFLRDLPSDAMTHLGRSGPKRATPDRD